MPATPFTSGIDLRNERARNVGDPQQAGDAVTLRFLQSFVQRMSWLPSPIRAVSPNGVDIGDAPASIDGVTLEAGNLILLPNQSDPVENGVWRFDGDGDPLVRPEGFASGSTQPTGLMAVVLEGSYGTDLGPFWILHAAGDIVVDTDPQPWDQLSLPAGGGGEEGPPPREAGNGLQLIGNALAVLAADGSISVTSDGISVSPAIRSWTYASSIGDGSSSDVVVEHNLGTRDVIINMYDTTAADQDVIYDATRTSPNVVTFHFPSPPEAGRYRVVIKP